MTLAGGSGGSFTRSVDRKQRELSVPFNPDTLNSNPERLWNQLLLLKSSEMWNLQTLAVCLFSTSLSVNCVLLLASLLKQLVQNHNLPDLYLFVFLLDCKKCWSTGWSTGVNTGWRMRAKITELIYLSDRFGLKGGGGGCTVLLLFLIWPLGDDVDSLCRV